MFYYVLDNEIFAISSSILLRGSLEDEKINFEEITDFSSQIRDLSLSPTYIYIVIEGNK